MDGALSLFGFRGSRTQREVGPAFQFILHRDTLTYLMRAQFFIYKLTINSRILPIFNHTFGIEFLY